MTPIAPLIEVFLHETLAGQRGVSRHTRDSYALSFQLLFMFAAERLKVWPSALTLEQLDAGLISAFLEYLEDTRKNAPVTRNVRLAAIKSFFRFLEYRQPVALDHVRRVLAIPFKKTDQRLVRTLPLWKTTAAALRAWLAFDRHVLTLDIAALLQALMKF
jgi:integrase/recombinase XerD